MTITCACSYLAVFVLHTAEGANENAFFDYTNKNIFFSKEFKL